jgi:hypothetical protein
MHGETVKLKNWKWQPAFGLQEIRGIRCPAKDLLVSQKKTLPHGVNGVWKEAVIMCFV